MPSEKIKAIKDTIKHWEDMIEWVEKQPPTFKPDVFKMFHKIEQDWFDESCALCKISFNSLCTDCPLAEKFGKCIGRDPRKNAWILVHDASTWKEWLTHAKVLLKQLKSLLPKKKGK